MDFQEYLDHVVEWAKKDEKQSLNTIFFENNSENIVCPNISRKIKEILSTILIKFDKSSYASYKGDPFTFYKEFNEVLHNSLCIYALVQGDINNWLNPANILKNIENEIEREFLTSLFPNIKSENFNPLKENYIIWFMDLLEQILEKYGSESIPLDFQLFEKFLHAVFNRDFLMNFRKVNHLKNIYRSPLPSNFLAENGLLEKFLIEKNIKLIIDLRGEAEQNRSPYIFDLMKRLRIKNITVSFNEKPGSGPGYVRKLMLKEEIKTIFNEIFLHVRNGDSILFHCHSGKDRTGVLAALLQKLAGINDEEVIYEYSLSGQDARPSRIKEVLKFLSNTGGIHEFLSSCGIDLQTQMQLKSLITE